MTSILWSFHIVNEGIATAEDVDKTMKYGFGFRWAFIGPFTTSDFGGVDTFYRIASYLLKELSTMQEPPQMMKELLDTEEIPTAVFTANDAIAFGAMKAIAEKGLAIPKDISIVGYFSLIKSSTSVHLYHAVSV